MIWIEVADAIAIHGYILTLDPGTAGIRDHALLESAIARPQTISHYKGTEDVVELGAAYISAVVHNHAFVDGNKRAALLVGMTFMDINGVELDATPNELAIKMEQLAAKEIPDEAFVAFLQANVKIRR